MFFSTFFIIKKIQKFSTLSVEKGGADPRVEFSTLFFDGFPYQGWKECAAEEMEMEIQLQNI